MSTKSRVGIKGVTAFGGRLHHTISKKQFLEMQKLN
jgi:hypothetical protein